MNDMSRERCDIETAAEEEGEKMVRKSDDRRTRLKIYVYVKPDRQEEVIPIR